MWHCRDHSVFVGVDGRAFVSGSNDCGQLGTLERDWAPAPVQVPTHGRRMAEGDTPLHSLTL